MNFLVTMSGGTTQVINSTLSGCIDGIRERYPNASIIVPRPGITGLQKDHLFRVRKFASTSSLKLLPGSSITGTTRIKILDDHEISSLEAKLLGLNVGTWINIGGSGTIKQSLQLSSAFNDVDFIALPKTIDNDLGDGEFKQLSYTPGYLSAVKYMIAHTYNLIRENEGACSNDKVIVSQVFGRDTSHIAAAASLVKNDRVLILFPEQPHSWDSILTEIQIKISKLGGCVIVVPEGYQLEDFKKEYDLSGQVMWGSSHDSISQIITNRLNKSGIQTRLCNTTIEERQCYSLMDSNDIERAYQVGRSAITAHSLGARNFFNSIDKNLEYTQIPLSSIKDFNRKFPIEWIDGSGFTTNPCYDEYIKSIAPGETVTGIPYLNPEEILEPHQPTSI